MESACDRVVSSQALPRALEVLVALGNFLNLNSVNGEAEGVMIDSLNKLRQVKSYGSQTTGLHYFTLVCQDRAKEIFNLSQEVGDCRGAAGVVLSQLTAEMNILRKGFESLKKELKSTKELIEKSKKISTIEKENMRDISTMKTEEMNNIFQNSLDLFLTKADEAIQQVEDMGKVVVSKFEEVKIFYGEYEATQPETFFTSLADFLVDFEKSRRDNEESRIRSKKKRQNKLKREKRSNDLKLKREAKAARGEKQTKHLKRGSASGFAPPKKAATPPALRVQSYSVTEGGENKVTSSSVSKFLPL